MSAGDRTTRELAHLLSARAGLRLTGAGQLPQAVLQRAARRAGAATVESYAAAVASGDASISALVEEARIGETYFFREPHQLAFLQREVLEPAASSGAPVRVWSAGCASGEEPYSIAMLLAAAGMSGEVLGTDISEVALAAAKQRRYSAWSLRGPWKDRALPYLAADADGRFTLDRALAAKVRWRTHNLVAELPPPPASASAWDAILCRNVLIYFDEATQQRVIEALAGALRPGGFLLLGSCDPPAAGAAPLLEPIIADEGVFYRRRGPGLPVEAPRARLERPPAAQTPPRIVGAPAPRTRPAQPPLETALGEPLPVAGEPLPVAGEPDEARRHCLIGLEALELGDREAALQAFRRALYLDPDLVVAELASAGLHAREGDARGAIRGYQRALRLARTRPEDDEVPLASGATYGDIVAHCQRTLASLGDHSEVTP
ncbi:MAG: methyltransferase, CheR-type [Labilithrix sp.]|nr:methyltransferase, CheR-type [Labilithrix sp.]